MFVCARARACILKSPRPRRAGGTLLFTEFGRRDAAECVKNRRINTFFFFKAEPLAGWAGPGKLGGAESQFVGVESF